MGRIPAERNTTYSRINLKLPPKNGEDCVTEHSFEAEFR
jgi:hypothetical protein